MPISLVVGKAVLILVVVVEVVVVDILWRCSPREGGNERIGGRQNHGNSTLCGYVIHAG